jgi:hypothetical protein
MSDPVVLYKGDEEKRIASIDAPAWIADGWSTEKPEPSSVPEPLPESVPELSVPDPTTPEAEEKASVKRK